MSSKNRLILEFNEFNLQRMYSDTGQMAIHVDNPQLSTNAFDKHQDAIRAGYSKINNIIKSLSNTPAFVYLRSKLLMENQDIRSLKILRIISSNNVDFNVYLSFIIEDNEYWGCIYNILSLSPEFKSEVFKSSELLQAKDWKIKISGYIINTVKKWLSPESGIYKLVNDSVICYSVETGRMLKLEAGTEIELIRSYDKKILIKYLNDYYNLTGNNYIYFNYWFELIEK